MLAANAVLLNFLGFASYGLDGFAHAAETLAGAAIGRRDSRQLARVIQLCFVWGLVGALLYVLVYALAGESLVTLLIDQPTIVRTASEYLVWAVLAPAISMPAYLYDGVFLGATRTLMLVMMVCSASFVGMSFALVQLFQNHGLWASFLTFNALRGLCLAATLKPVVFRPLRDARVPF